MRETLLRGDRDMARHPWRETSLSLTQDADVGVAGQIGVVDAGRRPVARDTLPR
jgi:hypothetical protein